jgi:Mrp family chromosome partitioning ATPase
VGVSPYVNYQPQRKPQLRYRIEPTHAPWGQTAVSSPHIDASPLELPDVDHASGAADEVSTATAWAAEGAATLVETAAIESDLQETVEAIEKPAPRQVVLPEVTAKLPERAPSPSSQEEGILCLPGMDVPESSYLAALLAASAATIESDAVIVPTVLAPVPQPEPLVEPALTPIVRPSFDVEEAVNAQAPPAAPANAVEPTSETTVPPSVENTTAFWEVDQFFYPTISDRLLLEYDYFSQAGEKLKHASEAGLKVLGVTGVGRSEGRTTLAICLARAASRSGLKVGLIDCDFQRHLLAQTMGLDVSDGWQSVASGKLELAEVAVRSLGDGITLLPLTGEAAQGGLAFSDTRVARVLAEAKDLNDVVILDLGPLDPATVAAPLPLDAAIVVWDGRRRQREEVQAVARALHAAGTEAVGIAENFASAAE